MKQKESFSELLQRHKKIVFISMVVILFIGSGKLIYDRFFAEKTEFGANERMTEMETKIKSPSKSPGVNPMEFMDIYDDINNLQDLDTLELEKLNEKLDKLIQNEN